jgi:hypothetical protein
MLVVDKELIWFALYTLTSFERAAAAYKKFLDSPTSDVSVIDT